MVKLGLNFCLLSITISFFVFCRTSVVLNVQHFYLSFMYRSFFQRGTEELHLTAIYTLRQKPKRVNVFNFVLHIENTSWKVLTYGIYARVVDVSEIERVSAANE